MNKDSESQQVTIIALTRMIQLLSAELVAGTHRDDFRKLEQAMRSRIGQIEIGGLASETVDKGVAEARLMVEKVLANVRMQVEILPQPALAEARRAPGRHLH